MNIKTKKMYLAIKCRKVRPSHFFKLSGRYCFISAASWDGAVDLVRIYVDSTGYSSICLGDTFQLGCGSSQIGG